MPFALKASVLTGNKQEKTEKADIMPIVLACMSMSKGKVGALIVCTGMAMLARLNNDEKMFEACKRLPSCRN